MIQTKNITLQFLSTNAIFGMLVVSWQLSSDMSFCRGSVNCHGSDGQMYHFCESSRSGEIFLDQYRGVGVFIPRDKFIRIGLFRSVNRPSVAKESWPTPVTHWNFNTSGCDSKLNIILIGLTDDPSGQSVSAMYLMWLATQYTHVFRARVTVMTLSTWHSGPVVALR